MLVAPRYRSEGPTHGAHRARVWGVGSGAHNPLAGMPREAVDRASRIRLHGTPHRGIDLPTEPGRPAPGGNLNRIGTHYAHSRTMTAGGGGDL